MKAIMSLFGSLIVALLLCSIALADEPDGVSIALVFDGPGPLDEQLTTAHIDETLALLRDEFEVSWPDHLVFHGDWTAEGAARAMRRAISADDADIVVAMGPVAAASAAQVERPKPLSASSYTVHFCRACLSTWRLRPVRRQLQLCVVQT